MYRLKSRIPNRTSILNPVHKRQLSLQPYITKLRSQYPSADLASLVASFIVLHEVTAIVPLFAGFWACRAAGVGLGLVTWAAATTNENEPDQQESSDNWIQHKFRTWIQQGQLKAERIGKHYGVLGYEKQTKEQRQQDVEYEPGNITSTLPSQLIGSDAANLVAAYIGVKVSLLSSGHPNVRAHWLDSQLLLPLRILVSLRLAPPLANVIAKRFQGLRGIGSRWLKKQSTPP